MKKLLTTIAVLTAFATPTFAQSFDPDNGTGNVPSIRTVQQPPAVEAWVTMNYFAPFELMKKQGGLWPALFSGLPGRKSGCSNDVAEPRKATTNEMARDSSRVDVGVYVRCRVCCSSGTARRIERPRGSDVHSKGPRGELKNAFLSGMNRRVTESVK